LAQVFEITSKHQQFVGKRKGAGSFGFSRLSLPFALWKSQPPGLIWFLENADLQRDTAELVANIL
jgi:hypothetical protein